MAGFARALDVVLDLEGGYANHPADRGGPTMNGITQDTYNLWRVSGNLEVRHVREITDEEVQSIYHMRYWHAAKCDALPWPVSLWHFDAAVNQGVSRANRQLQEAVGVETDGRIGPITLGAVDRMAPDAIAHRLLWIRLERYARIVRSNPSQSAFIVGWAARVRHLWAQTIGREYADAA